MHLPLIKALVAIVSASVLAAGVSLAPAASNTHGPRGSSTARRLTPREGDGLGFLEQLVAGNVTPDTALKRSWIGDVTAVAHTLGLSDSALARQLGRGRSLVQIAASRGVPTSTPTTVLLHHLRDDLHRAEQDQAHSPAAARALTNAIRDFLDPAVR